MITQEGYNLILNKINELTEKQKYWIEEKRKAAQQGDLSENSEYEYAVEEIERTSLELIKLTNILAKENVFDISNRRKDRVVFGSFISLNDENKNILKVRIVGSEELTFIKDKNYLPISTSSPMGKELIGKEVGDEIVVKDLEYTIVDIK